MNQLLDLTAYRSKVVAQRAFGPWRKRFGESYGVETRLADLSDNILYRKFLEALEAFHARMLP